MYFQQKLRQTCHYVDHSGYRDNYYYSPPQQPSYYYNNDHHASMMRMVPPSPQAPLSSPSYSYSSVASPQSFEPSSIDNPDNSFLSTSNFVDFDLDLLPTSDYELPPLSPAASSSCLTDVYSLSPPSPSDQACLSPQWTSNCDLDLASPTMFSPTENNKHKILAMNNPVFGQPAGLDPQPRYVPSASPVPSSPYSPASRPTTRFSSTDSGKTSTSSLLIEFEETRSRYNKEQEQAIIMSPNSPSSKATVQVKVESMEIGQQQQTPLLKQMLQDQPYKSKYVSFDFGFPSNTEEKQEGESLEDQVKIEPVLSMAMDHLKNDVQATSAMLNISPDPIRWSKSDVARWLRYKMQELKIPLASTQQSSYEWTSNIDGPGLVQLSETDFKQRLPQGGEQIYEALDMWRSAATYTSSQFDQQQVSSPPPSSSSVTSLPPPVQYGSVQDAAANPKDEFDISYVLDMLDSAHKPEQNLSFGTYQQQFVDQTGPNSSIPSDPPSFEAHMAAQAAASMSKPMPPIQELLQQQPLVSTGSRMLLSPPPPAYPGNTTSTVTLTTLQPPVTAAIVSTGQPELMDDSVQDNLEESSQDCQSMSSPSASASSSSSSAPASSSAAPSRPAPGPIRSTSNIHLWQFVKELLNQPHLHSGCIHWLDRERGIFKIVDSVRVADLWGKRKNRPAMNYDKLSRSLRQYYKKGIMKKTERTQRLVYQFCTPYHL